MDSCKPYRAAAIGGGPSGKQVGDEFMKRRSESSSADGEKKTPLNSFKPYRAAVIGGGPSGVQAAGEFMKRGFEVTLFERHEMLGGTWCYKRNEGLSRPQPLPGVKPYLPAEVSAVYKELRTNIPFQSMAIGDFSIPDPEDIRYAHRSETLTYIRAYVAHLEENYQEQLTFRMNTTVKSIQYGGGWSIISESATELAEDHHFDAVVVATGPFQKPIGGNLHNPEFNGIAFHSMYYDDPAILVNRTVLIVGSKNSARDMFWDAMKYGKHVVIASPREQDRNNLILPHEDYRELYGRYTSVGRVKKVKADGTIVHINWRGEEEELEDISVDMIIYCTGYKREFSFLSPEAQPACVDDEGREQSNCFMLTAHKLYPSSLFFFHPLKARTPFNTMARETHAQARLMASLATQKSFSMEQFTQLDEKLMGWLELLYVEWAKETLNSCPCVVQNPLLMNFLNSVVDNADALRHRPEIGEATMEFVRKRMKTQSFRKQNTIWHAGMHLRDRPDAVNWNLFRFLKGRLTSGPDIDGREQYTLMWFLPDGQYHSSYHEDEIKYEDVIFAGTIPPSAAGGGGGGGAPRSVIAAAAPHSSVPPMPHSASSPRRRAGIFRLVRFPSNNSRRPRRRRLKLSDGVGKFLKAIG